LVVALAITSTVACGKTSSTTVAGPSPAKCQLSATNSTPSFSASGGQGSIAVQAARECAWTAAAQADWVTLVPPAQGQGDSTLKYTVQPNPSGLPRRAAVNVAGQVVDVGQEGAPCRLDLDRLRVQVGAVMSTVDVAVRGPVGCPWTAASQVDWITVAGSAQGSGPGLVALRVAPNAGPSRLGVVLIAGVRFEVTQGSPLDPAPPPQPGCTYTLLPVSTQVPAAGGQGSVSLTTGGQCPWQATSDQTWLSVTSASSGTGAAQIAYLAAANDTGAPRTARLTVGNAVFTVDQPSAGAPLPPACTFTVTPTGTILADASGSTGTLSIATTGSCAWTATTSAGWIRLSTAGGTGPGQVDYTIDPNPQTTERTGSITVAGATIAVQQNAATLPQITLSGAADDLAGSCPALTFTLEGRTVTTSTATTYRSGSCQKLKNGASIIVSGFLAAQGTVDASEIEFTK
jgi:hypothetical protein